MFSSRSPITNDGQTELRSINMTDSASRQSEAQRKHNLVAEIFSLVYEYSNNRSPQLLDSISRLIFELFPRLRNIPIAEGHGASAFYNFDVPITEEGARRCIDQMKLEHVRTSTIRRVHQTLRHNPKLAGLLPSNRLPFFLGMCGRLVPTVGFPEDIIKHQVEVALEFVIMSQHLCNPPIQKIVSSTDTADVLISVSTAMDMLGEYQKYCMTELQKYKEENVHQSNVLSTEEILEGLQHAVSPNTVRVLHQQLKSTMIVDMIELMSKFFFTNLDPVKEILAKVLGSSSGKTQDSHGQDSADQQIDTPLPEQPETGSATPSIAKQKAKTDTDALTESEPKVSNAEGRLDTALKKMDEDAPSKPEPKLRHPKHRLPAILESMDYDNLTESESEAEVGNGEGRLDTASGKMDFDASD